MTSAVALNLSISINDEPPRLWLSFTVAGEKYRKHNPPKSIQLGVWSYCIRLDRANYFGITFDKSTEAEEWYQKRSWNMLFEYEGRTTVWIRQSFTVTQLDSLNLPPPINSSGGKKEPGGSIISVATSEDQERRVVKSIDRWGAKAVQEMANVKRRADKIRKGGRV